MSSGMYGLAATHSLAGFRAYAYTYCISTKINKGTLQGAFL